MKYNMIYYIYASKAKNNIVPSKCVNSTKHLPKKQTKPFMVFFGSTTYVEEHFKSLEEFDNQKGFIYDVTKDGTQWLQKNSLM